jgi:arabinogalactan oligomer/maltooligosaccharide transport system substrate-binding protein
MKFRKIVAMLLVAVMVFAFAACKKTDNKDQESNANLAGTYDIVVWVGEDAVELTKTQIANFNKENGNGITINATVNGVSEATAADQMLADVSAGADIYCFAQDQFARLVQGAALSKLGEKASATVAAANDDGVVVAATSGEALYAYPMTADNGYFMYYDKNVIPEEDVDSLEKLIADCEKANKFFAFEANTSAWYIASWFFAKEDGVEKASPLCHSNWTTDNDGNFVSVDDNFNSDNGLIAVKGLKKLVDSPMHISSSSADEFASDAAIVVSGTWSYEAVKNLLGDRMGVTDLPSFEVDGKTYHLGSFNGCKLMGVKPQTDGVRAAVLHKLAQYLTDEARQMERFEALSWGPANKNAQKTDAVQNNPGLAALLKQNAYSIPQGQIHGSWWDIAKVIGDDVKAAKDDAGLKAALETYYQKIDSLFKLDASALLFVGDWNGWNNADEAETYYLVKGGDGVYTITLDVPQADYMGGRIVKPGDWGNDKGFAQVTTGAELIKDLGADNPDNNIVFAEPGNYTLTWDGTAITIVKN